MTTTMQQELSAEAAVREVIRLSEERDAPPSRVVDEVLPAVNGSAGEELKRLGLIARANDEIHKGRNGRGERVPEPEIRVAPSGSGPGGTPSLRSETERMQKLRTIRLQTADGEGQVPLIRLSVEDHDANATRYHAQEIGARRKKEWCEMAAKSCRSAGVDRIEELSTKTREKLETEARKAWT